jgi:hypothetical protein
MTEEIMPIPSLPDPVDSNTYGKYRIAMIIDGIVHQVLVLEASDAARYLSEPVFIQIPRSQYVAPGDLFDGTSFAPRP